MSSKLLAGRRVLIVEDNFLLALGLTGTLEAAGAEIIGPVASVRDALDALDPLPDAATLDVQLGEETSFPIADELARRGVPFIFATGTACAIPAAHRERPICHKPVSDHALLEALADVL
ncbi:response regulator [Sphingomonas sp. 1P08PE]|jgi:CheY-like chemotaxis protein|uniref:response regulator n=1 Tax=Sphingomonas sp. 1P08PE TaxID=554122 RepID=UPI00399F8733